MQVQEFRHKPRTPLGRGGFEICEKLQSGGHHAYFVGGVVRDYLLKRKRTDVDIATSATPDEVVEAFSGETVVDRDKAFGTIRVVLDGGRAYEITTFRSEGVYKDKRRPSEVVFTRDPSLDAKRRDFTMNAIMFDPIGGKIIDYEGGLNDVKNEIIRFIGDPDDRVKEDPLRMLRGVRFSATLGFRLDAAARTAILQNGKLIQNVSKERIREELNKMIMSDNGFKGFLLLREVALLKYVIPYLDVLVGVKQDPEYHQEGNVFTHSVNTLQELTDEADLELRWASLLHDIGKLRTTERKVVDGTVRVTAYRHEVVGSDMMQEVLGETGLRFSNASLKKIRWLVRNHMMIWQLKDMRKSKRLRWATHKWFFELLELNRADNLGRITTNADKLKPYKFGMRQHKRAQRLLKGRSLEEHFKTIITGEDVKEIMGVASGPKVGNLLREIKELFFKGEIRTRRQALRHLRKKKQGIKGRDA